MPQGAPILLFLSITRNYTLHKNTPFPGAGHIWLIRLESSMGSVHRCVSCLVEELATEW